MSVEEKAIKSILNKASCGLSLGAILFTLWINLIAATVSHHSAHELTHIGQLALLLESSGTVIYVFPIFVLGGSFVFLVIAYWRIRRFSFIAAALFLIAAIAWWMTFIAPSN